MQRALNDLEWKELRKRIKASWPKVSDDELDRASDDFEAVASLIAERYGADTASSSTEELERMWTAAQLDDPSSSTALASGQVFQTWHPGTYDKRRP